MKLNIYQVDAFARKLFCGNPASVIPLTEWLPTELMQQLAVENNQSETVFFIPSQTPGAHYDIRWFTPGFEINLCGHATLAAAFIVFEKLGFTEPELVFNSQSGFLRITREGERLCMDFPSWKPAPDGDYPPELLACLGNPAIQSVNVYREWIVELENEEAVQHCRPDFALMRTLDRMVIITARGNTVDFVSRFFGPNSGLDEDPVTGSAHSQLIPFWSEKLGKTEMQALQLSRRGGEIECVQLNTERVVMKGKCVFYMEGTIYI